MHLTRETDNASFAPDHTIAEESMSTITRPNRVRRTGLICNGRHVGTENWEEIVWGKPPLLGQLPQLIQVFLTERETAHVTKIIFGTGASKRGDMFEAECMLTLLFENFHRLPEFPQFAYLTENQLAKLRVDLQAVIASDTKSQNTQEEIISAIRHFADIGITRVICVTCPTHAPRCFRDMQAARDRLSGYYFPDGFYVTPSDVHYAHASASDVIVLEPPHRGDTPRSFGNFHADTKRLVEIFLHMPEGERQAFLTHIEEVCLSPIG